MSNNKYLFLFLSVYLFVSLCCIHHLLLSSLVASNDSIFNFNPESPRKQFIENSCLVSISVDKAEEALGGRVVIACCGGHHPRQLLLLRLLGLRHLTLHCTLECHCLFIWLLLCFTSMPRIFLLFIGHAWQLLIKAWIEAKFMRNLDFFLWHWRLSICWRVWA